MLVVLKSFEVRGKDPCRTIINCHVHLFTIIRHIIINCNVKYLSMSMYPDPMSCWRIIGVKWYTFVVIFLAV